MTALTYVGGTSAGNGSSTQRTISVPAGVQNGDFLRLGFYIEATGQTLGGLTGWTVSERVINIATTPDFEWFVLHRIANSEPADYVITWDGGSYWNTAHMTARSGGDATTQQDATPSENTGVGTSLTGLSITTATADSEVILTGGHFTDTVTGTPPTGMTERIEFGTNYEASGSQATAGASGDKTATLSASDDWAAIMVADKAAGGAPAGQPVTKRWGGVPCGRGDYGVGVRRW